MTEYRIVVLPNGMFAVQYLETKYGITDDWRYTGNAYDTYPEAVDGVRRKKLQDARDYTGRPLSVVTNEGDLLI